MNARSALFFLFLSLGIVSQYYFKIDFIVLILFGVLFLCLIIANFWFENRFIRDYILLFYFVIFFVIGNIIYQLNNRGTKIKISDKDEVTLLFTLESNFSKNEFNTQHIAKIHAIGKDSILSTLKEKILVKKPIENQDTIFFNKIYIARGTIKKIRASLNPTPFNFKEYLNRQNIYYQITLDSIKIYSETNTGFISKMREIREQISYKIDNSPIHNKAKKTLKALTLAIRTDFTNQEKQELSQAGIIHIFAISGLHIGLIFGFILYILNGFSYANVKKTAIIFSLIFISLYGLFLGFPISVLRSIIMLYFAMGFLLLKRKYVGLHAWSMAGISILLFNPNQLFEVGFQLSFSAVFFILWLYKPIKNHFNFENKFLNQISSFVIVTFTAQLGTLPFVLFYFQQYSFLSFFANLLVVPFVGILVIFSFEILFQIFIFPNFEFTFKIYNEIITLLFGFTHKIVEVKTLLFTHISFNLYFLIFSISILFLARFVINKNRKIFVYFIALVLSFQLYRLYYNYVEARKKEIIVYQVYKNTAIGILNGNDFTLNIFDSLGLGALLQYSIKPIHTNKSISINIREYDSISIDEQRITILNKNYNYTKNSIVVVRNSPDIDWDSLLLQPAKLFILDGSNYPNYIQHTKEVFIRKNALDKLWITAESGYYSTTY